MFLLRQEIRITRRDSMWRAVERQKLKRRALCEDKENMDAGSYQNILQGKMTRLSLSPISNGSVSIIARFDKQ